MKYCTLPRRRRRLPGEKPLQCIPITLRRGLLPRMAALAHDPFARNHHVSHQVVAAGEYQRVGDAVARARLEVGMGSLQHHQIGTRPPDDRAHVAGERLRTACRGLPPERGAYSGAALGDDQVAPAGHEPLNVLQQPQFLDRASRYVAVAADGRDALKQLQGMSNARLLFVTERRGGYLADVPFTVTDARSGEKLVQTRAEGPICLLQLPPGRYRVNAEFNGAARHASFSVGKSGIAEAALRFPGDGGEDIPASAEEKRQACE